MAIVVFTGPTLPIAEARQQLDAIYLPPIEAGDLYRALEHKPTAIGIIDGYFEMVPSVWHKEILYAMEQGVHVLGAASMGALRAAELRLFGMEGVGSVYEAYRDGLIEDDDEVAVLHGPKELGYPLLSEAMVNIRRTLADACAGEVISEPARASLEANAKALHYKDRNYAKIVEDAGKIEPGELAAFRHWLPAGRKDQKKEDALALIDTLLRRYRSIEPKSVRFNFERTVFWEKLVQQGSP